MVRSFDEEMKFLDKVTPTCWKIKQGFVPNMNVCSPIFIRTIPFPCYRWATGKKRMCGCADMRMLQRVKCG